MTGPEPRVRVRVLTLGRGSRLALAIALVIGGALALLVGTTLLVALLGVAVVAGAVGAIALGVRRLLGGGPPVQRPTPPLDPTMEVFPEVERRANGTRPRLPSSEEIDDDRHA